MTNDQFKQLLEQNNTILFGQLSRYFDMRVKEITARLDAHDTRFNQIMNTLDKLSKDMETEEQERTVINHQLERHAGWIGQVAKTTNTKLVPEQ